MEEKTVFELSDVATFKQKVLYWANQFSTACYLDNNACDLYTYQEYEGVVGVDSVDALVASVGNAFDKLKKFHSKHQKWIMGFLTYDLKNELETLQSTNHHDGIEVPDLFFFVPRYLFLIKKNSVSINRSYVEAFDLYNTICQIKIPQLKTPQSTIKLTSRISKESYVDTLKCLKQHIKKGDIYEINFCQEFFAENANINTLSTFQFLNQSTQAPFASYVKNQNRYLLCASPERYIKKEGENIISQPIKGTMKKGQNILEDILFRRQLRADKKEQSENIMIVDLVRNDLSRTAQKSSVEVVELLGVYPFKQVNQLVSTIKSKIRENIDFTEVLRTTFPMGSMTGAPKVAALKLIDKYEHTKRGLYSGSVGYITPQGDFDFNVVIRSLLYNGEKKYLSTMVGGAITIHSEVEKEYTECLVKLKAMKDAISH